MRLILTEQQAQDLLGAIADAMNSDFADSDDHRVYAALEDEIQRQIAEQARSTRWHLDIRYFCRLADHHLMCWFDGMGSTVITPIEGQMQLWS